ncbi:MAG: hypothetical protein ABWY04_20090 [Arthrobacter sp.]
MAARPHALMVVLASCLLLALAGCTSDPEPEPDVVVDMLQQYWRHTPGVTAAGDGLQVAATARSIVRQDGGGGQPNPPLNLAGSHLVATGDFSLSASLEGSQRVVSRFYITSGPAGAGHDEDDTRAAANGLAPLEPRFAGAARLNPHWRQDR